MSPVPAIAFTRVFGSSRALKLLAGLLLVCLSIVLVLFFVRRSEAANPAAASELREMTHSEKVLVQKNMDYFQSLSATEQTELRELHEEIQSSSALRSTYSIYRDWLQTLTAWQRKELADAESIPARMQLVKRFLAENQEQENQKKIFDQLREEEQTNQQEKEARLEKLPEDVARVLEPLRKKLEISDEVEKQLAAMEQADQNVRILLIALQQEFRKQGNGKETTQELFTPELVAEMTRRLPDDRSRQWIEGAPAKGKKFGLIYYLHHQIETYFEDYEHEGATPGVRDLEVTFDRLDEGIKAQISSASHSTDRLKRLLEKYWLHPDLGEIERLLNSQRKRQFRDGGRGRGRFRRGDGNRNFNSDRRPGSPERNGSPPPNDRERPRPPQGDF